MVNADNPRTGVEFEGLVQAFFASQGLPFVPKLGAPVGIGAAKKVHRFDLGSETPPVLVECKCHVWTEGGNSPSAKLTVWNEAMLYFACAAQKYRKIMVVRRSLRGAGSLAEHYLRRYRHLVPGRVEIWEFDPATRLGRLLRESRGE